MKIRIEIDDSLKEEELVIHCRGINQEIQAIQKAVTDVFQTKHKLYELEQLLPGCFMRVSKSAILNVDRIYSITRNFTSACVVSFDGTPKEVYVSRNYYKALKFKLEERYHYEK